MVARRKLEAYPEVFQKITEAALKRAMATGLIAVMGQEAEGDGSKLPPLVTLPTQSKGHAANLMMQLRQYWLALAAEVVPEYDPRAGWLPYVNQIACRTLKTDPLNVEIVHRSQLVISQLVTSVLHDSAFQAAIASAEAGLSEEERRVFDPSFRGTATEVRPGTLQPIVTGQFRDATGKEMNPADQQIMKAAQDKVLEDLYGVKPPGK